MAAVATSRSNNNSPHLGNKSMTSSPRTTRGNVNVNAADEPKDSAVPNVKQETQVPTINQPEASDSNTTETAPTTNAPLAPPPKPAQPGEPDYFSSNHSQFSREPNPFENAFGNPAETPGKPQLPGVNSLTSPASLLPAVTPNWPGSLRSGPLSPAMLTGPTSNNDYFSAEHNFNGSFPTPNESSLRSGLTPGGGGSMFPQPSPNSQAIYSQLQSGGATPGTLDFHRTAMTARAHSQNNQFAMPPQPNVTSQPQSNPNIQPDLDSKPYNPNQQGHQQNGQDPFAQQGDRDAANGLYLLANAGRQQPSQYGMSQQPQQAFQQQHHDQHTRNGKTSINSNVSGNTENGHGDYSDGSIDQKPPRNGRGKKGSAGKATAGKRKTDDTPSRNTNANKRSRGSNGVNIQQSPEQDDDDMMDSDGNVEMEETGPDGKKMTDEEKRKNFLERNRVAALKCRQRKKQWLANLQQKVEIFSTENDALAATVTQLREEIVGLKTLLLAHKECPVSQAQGLTAQAMQQITGDNGHQYQNPYGMMGQGMQQMQAQGQMRR